MSKGNDPAFASVWKPNEQQAHWGHKEVMHSGLTKREYFAGLAMQGVRANHETLVMLANRKDLDGEIIDLVAALAVQQADALLAELEKTA